MYEDNNHFSESSSLLMEMRNNGILCDFTINVKGRTFSVHKNVLASTIPYFYAMLTADMMESKKSEIVMQEVEPKYDQLLYLM